MADNENLTFDGYVPISAFVDWFDGEFDSDVVDRYTALLNQARTSTSPEQLAAAVEVATRYAAVDTGAIEGLYSVDRGFTRTIATQAASWEATLREKGERAASAINDALNAYDYVLDAATQAVTISEVWIRELHALICASQVTYTVYTEFGPQERPLPKGSYKVMPNSPTNLATDTRFHYAPVLDTAPEMSRFVQELRSEAFLAAHPVLQAAFAHYAYVRIHPFADGNGRVARAIASVYLYRAPGIPLVIFADQRTQYLDALEAADAGNPSAFIAFIEERTVDAVNIVRGTLQRTQRSVSENLARLTAYFSSAGVNEESRAAVARLRKSMAQELNAQISALSLPAGIQITVMQMRFRGAISTPEGYEDLGPDGDIYLLARAAWPTQIQKRIGHRIFVKLTEGALADLSVVSDDGNPLEVWLREVTPSQSETLKLKIEGWAAYQVARIVEAAANETPNLDVIGT